MSALLDRTDTTERQRQARRHLPMVGPYRLFDQFVGKRQQTAWNRQRLRGPAVNDELEFAGLPGEQRALGRE